MEQFNYISLPRRGFLGGALALATGGLLLACSPAGRAVSATRTTGTGTVEIDIFSNSGELVSTRSMDKIAKSPAQWKAELAPAVYLITRQGGTERAWSGVLLGVHTPGVFRCACCQTALYNENTKFESGTGWPSFYQPISKRNVVEKTDRTLGMRRTEVACALCDAHLGHVFNDGPPPTGLRYCMNSLALQFHPA